MATNPFLSNKNISRALSYPDHMRGMFGGNNGILDPYTTGYHMMYFFLPDAVTNNENGIGDFLSTVCKVVTVPGITVNPIEYNGLNDMKWYVPGTTVLERNTFDCTFVEMAGLPITQIMGRWVTVFRNILYGFADPTVISGTIDKYSQTLYKGKAVYCTMLPDALTVQFAAVFTGVFPTKIPTDSFDSDRATQDKREIQITFQFDQMLTGKSVESYAYTLLRATREDSDKFVEDKYFNETGDTSNSATV